MRPEDTLGVLVPDAADDDGEVVFIHISEIHIHFDKADCERMMETPQETMVEDILDYI